MKKYKVRLFYHTFVDVVVEANDEKDAKENAYCEAGFNDDYTRQFAMNAETDNDPDVECLDEE